MSEINPDFSFPLPLPQAIPQTQLQIPSSQLQPPANDGRPLSFSPKPKRHAHRRSAAMSEDLSAVELATLTSSPKPANPLHSPKVLSSPKPSSPKPHLGSHLPTPSHGPYSPYGSHGLYGGQYASQGTSQGSSYGPAVGPSIGPSLGQPQKPAQGASSASQTPQHSGSPQQSPVHTPPMQSPKLAPQRTPKLAPLPVGKLPSTPDARVSVERERQEYHDLRPEPRDRPLSGLRSPSRPIGEPGWLVPTPVVSPAPPPATSKHKKRRSFVQLFRRSSDQIEPPGDSTLQDGAEENVDETDDTLIAPVVTPRHSTGFEQQQQPTIDLDEALGCSFSHRPPDHAPDPLLESPFSKASSMGAVLEEDEDENGSEADSLFSVPRQRRRPASFLHGSIPAGSPRLAPPPPPAPLPSSLPSSAPISQGAPVAQGGSIAYVGPVAQPPSPTGSMKSQGNVPSRASSRSPSRSPRVSFEQVSNLAISDPPSVNPTSAAPSLAPPPPLPVEQTPPTHTKPAKGHQRRRSLIDRLIRR